MRRRVRERDARARAARVASTARARDARGRRRRGLGIGIGIGSAPAASRAHAGPHDVVVKRTTPRPTRAVTRTGAATTKSAKHHRRSRAWTPDAIRDANANEFHGTTRARREDLGTRANANEGDRFPYGEGFAFSSATCETEEMVALATALVGERATDAVGKRAGE